MALRESARLLSTDETQEIYHPWIVSEHDPATYVDPVGELVAAQARLYLAFRDVAEDRDED